MRQPRMTIRRWMIVVVFAALIFSAARLLLLSATYRARARPYEVALLGRTPIRMGPNGSHSLPYHRSARDLRAERMAEKYLHASRFPWQPVEPDPPEPK